MMTKNITIQIAIGLTCLLGMPAWAGGDHSHDAPSTTNATLKPRITASSDVFELVGVYEKSGLTLYLDKTKTTQPVTVAKIEYEFAEKKGLAQAQADGTYRINLPQASLKAKTPFVFTVTAGAESDLLAGDLVLKKMEVAHEHSWLDGLWTWIKSWFGAPSVDAHESSQSVTTAVDSPQRQSDGSVFLPKTSQRQLGIATEAAQIRESEKVQELTGRVIADPAGNSRVQAVQAGRFEIAGTGFPTIGQFVKQGQVLGFIRPSVGVIERANQNAQAIDLASTTETARKRLARLEQLEGTVAQKDIDAARIELQSLTERSKGIRASLSTAEALIAPTTGVISAVNVSLGQVVEAKESLFDIIDPKRLRIEAQVSPALLSERIQSGNASDGKQSYALRFLGMSRTLQNGTLPMQFAVTGLLASGVSGLAIGQPMQIFVATGDKLKGVVLPSAAIVKNTKNQNIVWVQHTPESFEAAVVTIATLSSTHVLVTQGLAAGDRVVVKANSLLNQIR